MTDETKTSEISTYVEDLIFKGQASKTETLLDGKLEIEITTLNGNDQLEIEQNMRNVTGTNAFILHNYQLWILAYTIKRINDKQPEDINTWFEDLKTQSSLILDLLISKQSSFEKDIRGALMGEKTIENFSRPASTDQE